MLNAKLFNSITKILPEAFFPITREYLRDCALRGEFFSFQLAYVPAENIFLDEISLELISPLKGCTRIRREGLSPGGMLAFHQEDLVLRNSGGLFPDPLYDMEDGETLQAYPGQCRVIHFSVRVPNDAPAGALDFDIVLRRRGEIIVEKKFILDVLPVSLPAQNITHTEWFYADCLMSIYGCEAWSERHWRIIENYFRNMTEHGINQIFTPIVTPPLDTAVGRERPTAQLLEIEFDGDGNWHFGFKHLERWIKLAKACGFRTFEISHLYTQWGAAHAPKIIAKTPQGEKQVFGWNTDAESAEYTHFLSEMLAALRHFFEQRQMSREVVFHVSDEPREQHRELYRRHLGIVREAVGPDFVIADAMSNPGFYEPNENCRPIPIFSALNAFYQAGITPDWTYHCCEPDTCYPNRFFHFPGSRVRILGILLYRYGMKGFLHWGFNFWYTQYSTKVINPYLVTDAGGHFPSGDAFLVYPGEDEKPVDSLRYEYLREAFQDYRALMILEERIGRSATVDFLLNACGGTLTWENYPIADEALIQLRHAVNRKITESK